MQKIIFKNNDNSIVIIHPHTAGSALGLQDLGKLVVPTGLSFWIVEDTDIPTGRTGRNKWETDGTEGPHDGIGD